MRLNLQHGTLNLLIIFILAFMFQYVSPRIDFDYAKNLYIFYPDSPNFRPWQLLTHIFSHGNFMHLLFNGIGVLMFGNIIEEQLGTRKFLLLFFISAAGALLLHFAVDAWHLYEIFGTIFPAKNGVIPEAMANHNSMCGASGALYGVIVAFGFYFPNQKMFFIFVPYPIKAKYLVPGIIVLDLILGVGGFEGDPIAHFAHLGGAITGFIIVKFWFSKYLKRGW